MTPDMPARLNAARISTMPSRQGGYLIRLIVDSLYVRKIKRIMTAMILMMIHKTVQMYPMIVIMRKSPLTMSIIK